MELAQLATQVGNLLRERKLTLVTAESCTGGLIAACLTDIPGSSTYMLGGVIAYADEVKLRLLGVRADALQEHGAVSEQVASQMARGARLLVGSDCAVSVTGIAGPGGWTTEKPVGLTYIGVSVPEGTWVRCYEWQGDRTQNRAQSVQAALKLLLAYLQGELC